MSDTHQRNTHRPSLLGYGLAITLAIGTFMTGHQLGTIQSLLTASEPQTASLFSFFKRTPQPNPQNVDLTEFWRVWELMDQKFAHSSTTPDLTPQERVEGAIQGMLRTYNDPYTTFFNKTDATAFDEDISGNFGGVGMEVGLRDNFVTVIAPLPETPAAKAGIQPGDIIVSINGTSTENMTVERAVRLIRGPEGTDVTLELARAGAGGILSLTITRAQIEIPTVKTERDGDVFIITLYTFNALADVKMQEALREYVASGSRRLILDLRGNPGGYMQSAINLASYFLPTGKVIVRERYSDTTRDITHRSSGRTIKTFSPGEIIVLIDGGSASASEIVAGALQQHNLATIVGTTSFGKGSVQELVPLPSGAALKVTVARWLTPNGTSISDGGLTPDVIVERTLEDRNAERDPQREVALQVLRGTYVAPASTSN